MNRFEQVARHLACIASQIRRGHWARVAFHWHGIRRALVSVQSVGAGGVDTVADHPPTLSAPVFSRPAPGSARGAT